NNLAAAREAYVKSLEIEPNNARAINRLGKAHYRLGAFDLALQEFEKAAQLAPDDPVLWENLGLSYEQLGRFFDAEQAFRQAIEVALNEDKSLYYNRLGVFLYTQ